MPATFQQGVCEDCADLDPTTSGSAVRAALRLLGRPTKDWVIASEVFADNGFDVVSLLYPGTTPQKRGWQHVTSEQRRELKRLYPFVLLAKIEASARPEPVPPPVEAVAGLLDRCGICAAPDSENWHGPISTQMRGGRTVRFTLDDRCADLYLKYGQALGPSLSARAFCEDAGETYDDAYEYSVRAYYELPEARQEAVQAPWDWVPAAPTPVVPVEVTVEALAAQVSQLQAELAVLRRAQG
jgi:hypothetical protein